MASFTAYVTKKGTVNYCGNLPYFSTTDTEKITEIPNLNNVKQIYSCQNSNILFLLNDGTVKGVGNYSGILGLGHTDEVSKLTDVPICNVKQICMGNRSVFFLLNDGTVKACGKNDSHIISKNSSPDTIFSLLQDIPIENVKKIRSNNVEADVFFFKNDGIYCSGNNTYNQLGMTGSNFDRYLDKLELDGLSDCQIVDIKCSYGTTFFLMKNGDVYVSGRNNDGQYGTGKSNELYQVPCQNGVIAKNIKYIENSLSGGAIFFITNDGNVISSAIFMYYGFTNNGNCSKVLSNTLRFNKKVINCISYDCRSFFILEDNTIMGCGSSSHGSLGLPDIDFVQKFSGGESRQMMPYSLTNIPFTNVQTLMNMDVADYNKFLIKQKYSDYLYRTNFSNKKFDIISDINKLNFGNSDGDLQNLIAKYNDEKNIKHCMLDLLDIPFNVYMEKSV